MSNARADSAAVEIRWALAASVAAGASVALAPAIPGAVRMHVLVGLLAVWIAVMVVVAARLGAAAVRRPRDSIGWLLTATGALGAAFVALGITEYWLVRALTGREALSWSIDWRADWNHAQAVARTGGVWDALDYAGEPISYHVGPAWTAGAVDALFGGGLHTTLFAVVPLLSVAAVFLALVYLLNRQARLPWRAAAAAVGITLALPALNAWIMRAPWRLLGRGVKTLLDPQIWWAPTVMFNAVAGLAAGLSGLALLLDRGVSWRWRAVGAVGLGVVISLKPQYFIGLGAVAGVIAVARLIGRGPFRPRSATLLWSALGALGLAVVLLAALPGFDPIFRGPVFRPGQTVYPGWALVRELGGLHVMLFFLGLGAYLAVRRDRRGRVGPANGADGPSGPGAASPADEASSSRSGLALLLGAALAFALVAVGLSSIELPFRPEIIERGRALGVPDAESLQQNNLIQSLIPLRILLALAGAGLVARWVVARRRSPVAVGVALIGLLTVFAPIPYILYAARNPDRAFDATADPGLHAVLDNIPRGDELVIASDQADPADDFHRPLNAELLPAYHGHRFYTANLRFQHWIKATAADRLRAQQLFFGTPWSPWHEAWLARTGVTHVLVHDRCPPAWSPPPTLRRIDEAGGWTAYAVVAGGASGEGAARGEGAVSGEAAVRDVAPPSGPIDLEPRYGRAACLDMLSIPGGRAWGERIPAGDR